MRPGYKQTEVGVIPEEWEVKTLPSALEFINGKAHEQHVLENGPFTVVNSKFVSTSGAVAKYSSKNFCPARVDDILMVMSDLPNGRALAKCYLVESDDKYAVNQRVCILRTKGGDARFFYFQLDRNPYFLAFDDGVSQTHLLNAAFRNCPVAVPPLPEQRAIAEALADADAAVAGLERLIAKKRDLKQAAMQQLLTGQTRLPGFSGAWEVKRLGEIGRFLKGSGVRRDQAQSGEIPCVRYGEIYTTHHDVIHEFTSFISPEVAKTATRIHCGDILFAGSGETKEDIGKCVALVHDFEAYAGGDIIILRPSAGCPRFLGYLLNTAKAAKIKANFGQGDAVVHIGSASLSKIEMELPDEDEQTAIATVLSDMDAELTALQAQLDKTRLIKQAMMQDLLTGRVRLPFQ
jgi:type I restriction enzyme S subunit